MTTTTTHGTHWQHTKTKCFTKIVLAKEHFFTKSTTKSIKKKQTKIKLSPLCLQVQVLLSALNKTTGG